MQKLNFPTYSFRFKNSENKVAIFDEIRKKFIILTPEEWVRQHVVQYLLQDKNYPKLSKRYDIIVYQPNGAIYLLIECKAPEVTITQQTFDQIARYNLVLNAKYLMVSNGVNHYFCQMDLIKEKYIFLQELPEFEY